MPPRRWKSKGAAHKAEDSHDGHAHAHAHGAAGGATGPKAGDASSESDPPSYLLFDGREDALLYWMTAEKEEKEELLHIEEDELADALGRAMLGGDSQTKLPIEPEQLKELRENGELMTAARLVFIDGIYAEGKAASMSDPGAPVTSAESASLDLILHSVLGVLERHVLLAMERQAFPLRLLAVCLFWVWSWTTWSWWVRYPLILSVMVAGVAAAAASDSLRTEEEAAKLSPLWRRVGTAFQTCQSLLLRPFDDARNPVLLRCRADLFLAAMLVLEHATWVARGRYIILVCLTVLLPALALHLDGGSGGWNKSAAVLAERRGAAGGDDSARGLRWFRVATCSFSALLAVYYAGWGSTWTSTLFVSALFFPSGTTVALSTSALVLTGGFMLFSKAQRAFLGDFDDRRVLYWAVWLGCLVSWWVEWGTSGGWILWLCNYLGLIVFTPPPVSLGFQLVGGGVCSLLLSVGLSTIASVLVKLAQLLLTREGIVSVMQIIRALFVASRGLVGDVWRTFVRGFKEGTSAGAAAGAEAAAEAAGAAAGGTHSDASNANDASEMN